MTPTAPVGADAAVQFIDGRGRTFVLASGSSQYQWPCRYTSTRVITQLGLRGSTFAWRCHRRA